MYIGTIRMIRLIIKTSAKVSLKRKIVNVLTVANISAAIQSKHIVHINRRLKQDPINFSLAALAKG